MEERMKRMESTLDILISRLPPSTESRNSVEPQPQGENDGFQGQLYLNLSLSSLG
jgi:hypothetical protein